MARPTVLAAIADESLRQRVITALQAEHALDVVSEGAAEVDLRVVLASERVARGAGQTVVLVPEATRRAIGEVLDGGAFGIVLIEHLESALGPTLAAVAAGQLVIPREARAAVRRPLLTNREKQVLSLVVIGFTNAQIATQFTLAESTVKSHLSATFAKLGVRTRKEAVDLILDPSAGLGTGILSITAGQQAAGDRA